MNFINQNTLKIVANIVLLLPVLVIDILIYLKNKENFFQKHFFIIFCLINVTIVQYVLSITPTFPYSDYIQFKNDKEIFRYYYPEGKIRKKYEYENDVFYVYDTYEESNFAHFVKNDNEWNWCNDELSRSFNNCSVSVHSVKDKDNARIFIRCHINEDSKFAVTDSNSSNFERFGYEIEDWMQQGKYDIVYTALLKKHPDQDYTITIDNKIYKFFK